MKNANEIETNEIECIGQSKNWCIKYEFHQEKIDKCKWNVVRMRNSRCINSSRKWQKSF